MKNLTKVKNLKNTLDEINNLAECVSKEEILRYSENFYAAKSSLINKLEAMIDGYNILADKKYKLIKDKLIVESVPYMMNTEWYTYKLEEVYNINENILNETLKTINEMSCMLIEAETKIKFIDDKIILLHKQLIERIEYMIEGYNLISNKELKLVADVDLVIQNNIFSHHNIFVYKLQLV
ncbi:hypothetical protein [Anaerovorax sp. IOR16]|uniref:hypothetical protein n=1 Tax=Anaerovorax sp. IOR16 TaxID=2773458 RepID=UPI0019D31F1E|nr:hypothetical protein [Anaerovorax sp. IOR16]